MGDREPTVGDREPLGGTGSPQRDREPTVGDREPREGTGSPGVGQGTPRGGGHREQLGQGQGAPLCRRKTPGAAELVMLS